MHDFIKPNDTNAATNMSVLTNKRTYSFDMEARKARTKRDKDLTYGIRFYYPKDALNKITARYEADMKIKSKAKQNLFMKPYDGTNTNSPLYKFIN